MKHTFPLLLMVAALGCASPSSNAQSTGAPASHTDAPFGLDASRLSPRTDVSDMYIVSGDERTPLGTATSTIERFSVGGIDQLRLVLVQRLGMGEMFDTLQVDAKTLRPIRYRNEMGARQSLAVDYGADGSVSSRVTRMGESVLRDTVLTGDFLDAAEFQPLIAALPLAAGYSTRIPVFHYEEGAKTVAVRVAGRSSVPYASAEREVWLVEYEANPGSTITLSIDVEDGRFLRVDAPIAENQRFEQVMR